MINIYNIEKKLIKKVGFDFLNYFYILHVLLQVPRDTNVCIDALFPGTWYLVYIDDQYRREYARKAPNGTFDKAAAINNIETKLSNFNLP